MLAKIGKGLLLAIGIAMILSVTVFDPAKITEAAKRYFGLSTGPRADVDIQAVGPTTGREEVEREENAEIRRLVDSLSVADTRDVIHRLSTLPASRAVGYPGNEMAAAYVEDAFRSIGLEDVKSQPFEVAVPVDEGGALEGEGIDRKIELFSLWPNEVRTSSLPAGFAGSLIDGHKGRFSDFDKKKLTRAVNGEEVADAVVLLDFDCAQNWMNAAMLGARAAVFFDPSPERPLREVLEDQLRARERIAAMGREVTIEDLRKAAGPLLKAQREILRRAGELVPEVDPARESVRKALDALAKGEMARCVELAQQLAGPPGPADVAAACSAIAACQDKVAEAIRGILAETPPAVTRGEAEQKIIGVAANFPRLWVSRTDGVYLREQLSRRPSGIPVRLSAQMNWRRAPTRNIIGSIPGTLPPVRPSEKVDYERERVIVLSAFYDATSVVPKVAPGAENACGLAALLQTAKVLKKFLPRHTVVFVATSGHFQGLTGVQQFLRGYLPTEDELARTKLPRERVDFDVFIGLDLTSHESQVATTCFGTFYDRNWGTDVYRKNLLAPYARNFTEYAAAVFRKSTSEAVCPAINAVTPPKKTWKDFTPCPVAFDSEPVCIRGRDGITIFTPNEIRYRVDTPNDTLAYLDVEKLHTQVRTIAALMAKAGRDVQFFTDSKLKLQNRINFARGNVTWFDRALNPNIPRAPIGSAVVTTRFPAAGMASAGVRSLVTTLSQPDNPRGGDYREGFYVDNVTLSSRRVVISVWSDRIGELKDAEAEIQTSKWLMQRRLEPSDGTRATIRVLERFVEDKEAGTVKLAEPSGEVLVGRWEAIPESPGKRTGTFVPPEKDDPRFLPPEGQAHVRVGNARFRGPIIIPPKCLEIEVDLDPPGALDRWLASTFGGRTTPAVEQPPNAPDIDPDTRLLRSLVVHGSKGTYTAPRNVNIAFGQFEGQFIFPFLQFWAWGPVPILAYKMDESGSIIYAQDEGPQGKDTYPNDVKFGGGAQCVLFRCRPLTLFEIVDSRYLTVLDQVGVLGPDNSVPQQWAANFIANQHSSEGVTTSAAVVYARYDPVRRAASRVKIYMGTGIYSIKLLLTRVLLERGGRIVVLPPEDPRDNLDVTLNEARGIGYTVDDRVLLYPSYRVAWDMWVLNEYRLRELGRYGITNAMLASFPRQGERLPTAKEMGLHDLAREALLNANKALRDLRYDDFMTWSRRAWGFEAKAYPDVASQADDTVQGVVFYFILLIPFAFFMERLLVGAADIRKRILGFAAIFLVVFAILRYVHPAFKLSTSPYIILLAFIILAMGVIVLFIVVNKFNQEIRKMKQAAHGVQQADVGRLSASSAAIMLGISNLRKRKIRTTLTAVTLTLLTFTVLSFTSINQSLYLFRLPRNNVPAYEGGLVRDRNWRGLQPIVLDYLRSEFTREKATIAPRAWMIAKVKGEKEVIDYTATGGISNVNGIVGLTPQEALVNPASGPQTMLLPGGRWFNATDRCVAILPDDVAARVGIKPEHLAGKADDEKPVIRMLGHDFRVIGLVKSDAFNRYRDIDDEKLTPVDTQQEAAKMQVEENPDEAARAPIQAFTHLEASNCLLIPYALAMDIGGTCRSIAISNFPKFPECIRRFMERVALNMFVAQGTGEDARVVVLSSLQGRSLGGVGNLFVPILIAALIVLNTMTGSVYERFREIQIYSSVGLAPTHIAALFLAESAVFATVGAVGGYLLGQTVAGIVFQLDWLGSITLNYSSFSAVYASVVVMATVFLSTIYPAKKASDMAVPDVTRRWSFPPPKGDDWQFDFPFTVGGAEILGMYCYLARFLQSYGETSIGAFYTEDVQLVRAKPEEEADYRISTRCWLAPYDLGISQDVRFEAVPTGEFDIYRIVVTIHRISGDTLSWQRMNRGFLNVLRKQFLVWRTVPSGVKLQYADEGKQIVGEAAPAPQKA